MNLPVASSAPLPALLNQVEETCGRPAALAFASRFGGRELYIPLPESIKEDHPIAQTLGLACARKLAKELGHHKILVPLGPSGATAVAKARRHEAVKRLKAKGLPNQTIAGQLGVHLRTVERWVATDEPIQPNLFDD